MTLLPKIILTTLVPVGLVSSTGVLVLMSHPHPPTELAALVIVMTIATALVSALLLRSTLMRPLELLMQAHAALQHGDRLARVRIEGNDEIAQLGVSFNNMAQALQQTEQHFRTIFEAFPAPVMLMRISDGRYIEANPAFCESTGLTRETLVGHTKQELGFASAADESRESFEELIRLGHIDNRVTELRDTKGQVRWAMYSARIIDFNGEKAALTLTIEITPQKQAEALLQKAHDELKQQTAIAHASEQRFRSIFEAFPAPVTVNRLGDAHFLDANPAFCAQVGLSREQLLERTALQVGLLSSIRNEQHYREMLGAIGSLNDVELPLQVGSETRWILFNTRLIELDGEQAALSVSIDITRQKQIEQALRASNNLLQRAQAMVGNSNDAMLLCAADGTFVECNAAALRIYGCARRDQFIGSHPVKFSPPLQPDGNASATQAKQLIDAALAGQPQRFLWQHLRLDGSAFMAEVALSHIADGDEQDPHFVAVVRDVTAQHQAEQELVASEERFRVIFEAFPHPISLNDLADRRYLDVNPALCRQRGLAFDQIVGKLPEEIGITVESADSAERRQQINSFGRIDGAVTKVTTADGGSEWYMYSSKRISLGSKPVMMAVAVDITHQMQIEEELQQLNASLESRVAARTRELSEALETLTRAQQELVHAEKLAALGSLVAGIAHELNTPIGNAVMMASTLADQQREFDAIQQQGLTRSALQRFTGTVQEASVILLRNLERAASLISSFKQVAVDQSSYQRRRFALAEVVDEIALTLSPSLRHSAVTLHTEVEPGIALDSYPGPLGQVLMNLINNAIVHAFADREAGNVVIRSVGTGAGRIGIEVRDDGCGMSADIVDRIFDPFFTTRLGQGGSGLGLHITYNLVTGLLGGSIRVHSEPGQGTRFALDLPLQAPADDQPDTVRFG